MIRNDIIFSVAAPRQAETFHGLAIHGSWGILKGNASRAGARACPFRKLRFNRLRQPADLLAQLFSLKNSKYIQYSFAFQTLFWTKISRRLLLPIEPSFPQADFFGYFLVRPQESDPPEEPEPSSCVESWLSCSLAVESSILKSVLP